jgi:putative membrane protein
VPGIDDAKNAGRGLLMGAADIVPGVSGGTVALVLGIYHRLVTAISRIDRTAAGHVLDGRWKDAAEHCDLRFLASLAVGVGSGIASLAFLMHYLLEHQLQFTYAVFSGLILGSGILVARSVDHWSRRTRVALVAGACFAWFIVGLETLQNPPEGLWYLFLSGMIGICAMILPGISGAFILLIMGRYSYVTGLIRGLLKGDWTVENFLAVAVFSAGCVFGLLAFSRLLRWLLGRFPQITLAVLCGFMLGSLRKLWPFKHDLTPEVAEFKRKQFEDVWPAAFDGDTLLTVLLAAGALGLLLAFDVFSRRGSSEPSRLDGTDPGQKPA